MPVAITGYLFKSLLSHTGPVVSYNTEGKISIFLALPSFIVRISSEGLRLLPTGGAAHLLDYLAPAAISTISEQPSSSELFLRCKQ